MRTLTLAALLAASPAIVLAQQPATPAPSTSPAPSTQGQAPTSQTPAAQTPAPSSESKTDTKPDSQASTTPQSAQTSDKSPDKTGSKDTASKPADTTAKKADPIPSPGEELDPHIRKGTEEDVNAVGARNIGGRGMGNWYSTNWEIGTGKQYSMEIEKVSHLVTDPVVVEYVNRIGQNLVKNSDAKVSFTIKVLDTDEINAMALPGGFFYVNSGLILAADEEAELAGVMAHEISHVAARHGMRQMTRANIAQIATIPLIFVGGGIGYGIYEAAGLGLPLTFMKFQRNFEAEADYLGLQYMYKTGYDPQAFISFFEKIQAKEKKKPGTISKAFASHPQTPDRIAASQKEIATILPARPQYIVSTSEFDDVKARLAMIENRHKVLEEKDGSKPSLRRASTSDKTGSGTDSSSSDDDRPTLKRRDDSGDQGQQQQQ